MGRARATSAKRADYKVGRNQNRRSGTCDDVQRRRKKKKKAAEEAEEDSQEKVWRKEKKKNQTAQKKIINKYIFCVTINIYKT